MSPRRLRAIFWAGSAAVALIAGACVAAARYSGGSPVIFADAEDRAMTTPGAHVYARQCAACHGRHLQGQPFWQVVDQDSGRRAPALDETGRAWLHGDEDLIHMIQYGRYPTAPSGPASHMPAFQARLDDRAILSVLAFVKARWPLGTRVAQAMRNRGREGMPKSAAASDWTFPGACLPREAVATTAGDR